MLLVEDKALQSQVDRILRSDEFRSSEVLRRLLKFLAEKSALGEADQLKEYAVAIDGLGKPHSYDPRHNSAVRIQVGRLRQKLAEYYRTEGKHDEFVVDLPKGRFKLTCEPRCAVVEPAPAAPAPVPPPSEINLPKLDLRPRSKARSRYALMWVCLTLAIAIGAYCWGRWLPMAKPASPTAG